MINPLDNDSIYFKYYIIELKTKDTISILYITFKDLLITINLKTKIQTIEYNTTNLPNNSISITYNKFRYLLQQHNII